MLGDIMVPMAQVIIKLIAQARHNALKSVNAELINLYWAVGKYLSEEGEAAQWGDKYIDEIANAIKKAYPGIKGFNRRGLYRMRQFYTTYQDSEFVSTVLTQISWSNHLAILSRCKTPEEREFYIRLCATERYSARELARQLDSAYYQRYMLSPEKLFPSNTGNTHNNPFLDTYVLEFLDLPAEFSEHDLRRSIIQNLKNFILEIGRDFTFMGEEYKVQVGSKDYFIDLLFFHRTLQCLVAFELKIADFKPEHIGKMNFYLEALDREYRRPHENPSIGVILCAGKDDEVVEYAMSRNLSPTLVSQYSLELIDPKILEEKLREFRQLTPVLEDME